MIWERKGLRIRLAAAAIDAVIIVAAGLALRRMLGDAGVVCGAFVALAYPLAEVMTAQSPGKWFLGLQVRDADSTPACRRQLARRVMRRYLPNAVWAGMQLAALTARSTTVAFACIALLIISAVVETYRKEFRTNRRFAWDLAARTAVLGRAGSGSRRSNNMARRTRSTLRAA